jgi:protein phosphatase
MISTQKIIYCKNPDCTNPINPLGNRVCANCQTPVVYRYLWAPGSSAAKIQPGQKLAKRYEVLAPQIWLDTQPGELPKIPEELPKEILNYLRLYQQQLHIPQVYGFVASKGHGSDIVLLENVPIDDSGNLYPALGEAWEQTKAVRQVYWLWQILQLWTPLLELGVAGSLLILENLRVQGWCVRLVELVETLHVTSLQDLGEFWQPLVATAKAPVAQGLEKIVQQMCSNEANLEAIASQVNELLLSLAAELPLNLKVAGATDTGSQLNQNEDTCYPAEPENQDDSLLPNVSIICDGIGGHQGGEVASQLATQSLKLQIRALLTEVVEQTKLVPPDLLQQQLEAILRVVNNVICNCNNEQKREGIQRMATTLVMAVQLPQHIETTHQNTHELYLASVGDSRAYWITRNYCLLLTVDDDVVGREVRYGRSLYRKALLRPDATSLTQALGTKDGEFLRPLIQRLILEEDGILLLCSDGLSDNNLVEHYWRDYAIPVLTAELSLEDAVREWINLANQKNGHDNISIVLTYCRVSPDPLIPITSTVPIVETTQLELVKEQELAESSRALLDLELSDSSVITVTKTPAKSSIWRKRLVVVGGLLALVIGGTSLGLFAWWRLNPQSLQRSCRKLPQRVQEFVCKGLGE